MAPIAEIIAIKLVLMMAMVVVVYSVVVHNKPNVWLMNMNDLMQCNESVTIFLLIFMESHLRVNGRQIDFGVVFPHIFPNGGNDDRDLRCEINNLGIGSHQ